MWRDSEIPFGIDGSFLEAAESDEFLDLTWDGGWTEAVDHGNSLGHWMLDAQFHPDSRERGQIEGIYSPSPRVIRG